jgi:type VI secretion system protein ImpK
MFVRLLSSLIARPLMQAVLRRARVLVARLIARKADATTRRHDEPRLGAEPADAALVTLAQPVWALVERINAGPPTHSLPALRDMGRGALQTFALRAQAAAVPAERVRCARDVLEALLDDAVQVATWGGAQWAPHRLAASAHAADTVFEMLLRLARDPVAHRELLGLIEQALAHGLAGRYRSAPGGAAKLLAARSQLARLLAKVPPGGPLIAGTPVDVSLDTLPPSSRQHGLSRRVPAADAFWGLTWAATATCASLLAIAALWASAASARWSWGGVPAMPPMPYVSSALSGVGGASRPADAAALLQADLQAGRIGLREAGGQRVIVISTDRLFSIGSAQLATGGEAMMDRLANLLAGTTGPVAVTAHTEAQPAATIAFSTRQQLSQARADAVRARLIAAGVPGERIRAQGRSDLEPLTADRSPHGSARNRRIEIRLPHDGAQQLVVAAAHGPAGTSGMAVAQP